jgi:NADPH-dependent 2,4-dienoyl-CoA reductase/sulfur reductase-like enzyme
MHVAVVGGSDAGIEAARRCREIDPDVQVSLLVADSFPNFSICGIPYHVSREVPDWRDLAHRGIDELEALGIELRLDHRVTSLDLPRQRLHYTSGAGEESLPYDRLVLATGAHPRHPPIDGLNTRGPSDGVHVLHTMPDTFALETTLSQVDAGSTGVIIGAGYVGLEMAEALVARGLQVVVLEQFPQVLPRTLDPELAGHVAEHLVAKGVEVRCGTAVRALSTGHSPGDSPGHRAGIRVHVAGEMLDAGIVLVATGVDPATELAAAAGLELGTADAIAVDRQMRTNVAGVWAAGDCVHTHHRLLDAPGYLPLGTTAHKQGRIAGENVMGGNSEYAGSLGTQAIKLFDRVAAATGLRDTEAHAAGFNPLTIQINADDHKRYYPDATTLAIRLTGDRPTGRLLGGQLLGSYGAEISKRIDVLAAAIHNHNTVAQLADLDLSYTPPLGSPWDALQQAGHAWQAAHADSP